jgi:site-specific DNA recombinase
MSKEPEKKRHLVCAIYTRKSTSEGLEQEFTSLDNQRESAENYIKSQQHEGWTVCKEMYDDGGFTGANIERPGLQRLLAHIKEGRVNCVVVYKVDRLSRSLLDFSQLLEFFDKNNVVFVSVTQQFNTNTSMGRLTLNILLSFAQFEREIISERTKDKMGAARRRGQWLGGRTPYGYNKDEKTGKLTVLPEEADIVKQIFELYLTGNSTRDVANIINATGRKTREYTAKSGKTFGNRRFTSNRITYILKNYTYLGKVEFDGKVYDGQQPAIIDEALFIKAQRKMTQYQTDRKMGPHQECSGLLTGILKCKACGTAMIHTYTMKGKKFKYRYYVCTQAQKIGYLHCPNRSIPSQILEDAVIERLKAYLANKAIYMSICKTEVEALLSPVWDTLFPEEKRRVLKQIVKEVDCDVDGQRLGVTFHDTEERKEFDARISRSRFKRQWKKEEEIQEEPKLRRTLILAHQLRRLMDESTIKGVKHASQLLNQSETRTEHVLNMLMLSPAIQSEIIHANPEDLEPIAEYKVRDLSFEIDWNKQIDLWQEAKKITQKMTK